ncbi:MAG: hypothetical protein K8S25_10725 [Alphaproteobacteria bacterium]|nr:hypothetical protein [Alphaproteobacteria bacterium]
MATATNHRPFPFLTATAETFTFFGANIGTFASVAWAWILISCVTLIAWMYTLIWLIRSDQNVASIVSAWSPRSQEFLLALPPLLVELFGLAVIAVNWHRFFILNERPRRLAPFHPNQVALYVGRTMLLFGTIMILGLLFAFVMMGVVAALQLPPSLAMAAALVPLAIMLFGFVFMLRASLAMPAAAIGDRKWTLERSWHETSGNGLRLFAGMFIVVLPFYIGNTAIALSITNVGGLDNPPMFMLTSLVSNTFAAIGAAVAAGYYSRAFVFFSAYESKDRYPALEFA